jgi:hypothetical protein
MVAFSPLCGMAVAFGPGNLRDSTLYFQICYDVGVFLPACAAALYQLSRLDTAAQSICATRRADCRVLGSSLAFLDTQPLQPRDDAVDRSAMTQAQVLDWSGI